MCSFSIILTSLHSFNFYFHFYSMLFLLLYPGFYLDYLLRHTDYPHFPHYHPHSPHTHADSRYSHFITRIPLILFPNSPFCFYKQLAQFVIFKNLFSENSYFGSKKNFPLCYYSFSLGTKLLFTSMMSSGISSKVIYLIVLQAKNL